MQLLDFFPNLWQWRHSHQSEHADTNCPVELAQVVVAAADVAHVPTAEPVPSPESLGALYDSCPLLPGRRQIRVIQLQEAEDFASSVSVAMRVVDLDQQPVYSALSYVWGDFSNPRDVIVCNCVPIEVTSNCLSALRHLRKLDGSVTLWVDAICIHQQDHGDKRHQLALMADIYSSARQVCAFLGDGKPDSDWAMDYFARGALPSSWLPAQKIRLFSGEEIPTGVWMSTRLALHLTCRRALRGFLYAERDSGVTNVLSRPWIRRLWTLQEAVLARELRIICGFRSVSWIALAHSLEVLDNDYTLNYFRMPSAIQAWRRLRDMRDCKYPTASANVSTAHRDAIKAGFAISIRSYGGIYNSAFFLILASNIYGLVRINDGGLLGGADLLRLLCASCMALTIMCFFKRKRRRLWSYSRMPDGRPASSIMVELRERDATESKDIYFGIRSLIHPPGSSPMLDYTETPLAVVFRLLSRYILEYTNSLDILLFMPSPIPEAPSWVVDWRTASDLWVRAIYDTNKHPPPDRSLLHSIHNVIGRFRGGRGLVEEGRHRNLGSWCFINDTELRVRGNDTGSITWSSGIIKRADFSSLADTVQKFLDMLVIWSGGSQPCVRRCFAEMPGAPHWYYSAVARRYRELRSRHGNPCTVQDQVKSMISYLEREEIYLVRYDGGTYATSWASGKVQVGDLVTRITGVSTLAILRRKTDLEDSHRGNEEKYEVIGLLYNKEVIKDKCHQDVHGEEKDYILV
ncbi:heterokaryon incompatibility protein-domain-containing protein [Xylariaceae sp. FL0804]|nr:heterokaryon incompatibility protein-domain-containing protein [Xylariaceae sp. FL0804]